MDFRNDVKTTVGTVTSIHSSRGISSDSLSAQTHYIAVEFTDDRGNPSYGHANYVSCLSVGQSVYIEYWGDYDKQGKVAKGMSAIAMGMGKGMLSLFGLKDMAQAMFAPDERKQYMVRIVE